MDYQDCKKIIKASFKECSIDLRQKFPDSNCIVPISVGQKVHEGEKLIAVLKLLKRSFKSCTILVDDTIQKYTLAIMDSYKKSLSEYNILAYNAGTDWLNRNKALLTENLHNFEIIRWDDFQNHPDFPNCLEKIKKTYEQDETYQSEFYKTIDYFLTRNNLYPEEENKDAYTTSNAFNFCLEYLFEECAVMMLWAYKGYHFEVYPSGRNPAMAATFEKIIQETAPGKLYSVGIRFKKYPLKNESN